MYKYIPLLLQQHQVIINNKKIAYTCMYVYWIDIGLSLGFPSYETLVPTVVPNCVPQPVVPSQIDMYNAMPPSPGSPGTPTSLSSSSPLSSPSSPEVSSPSLLPSYMSLTEKINKRIAQVNTLPDSFLPEFHQYSKETYENGGTCMKRKRRRHPHHDYDSDNNNNNNSSNNNDNDYENGLSAAEIRRQVHIQSEQKRRAQIKDGFEVLRQHLPGCANKKMSKAALLHRTVQHIQHMKKNQASIMAEIERLVQENEKLKAQQQQQRLFI
ncbi:uncharacterized protein BX663DRAFT_493513 [Cokeromyces recurvatus]|uniref:uncharacterized protein n=1 Tax=Cokeromyces recurvatus TaxID=90255 RepID=UPI00221F9803|nr:uncharacterized protein BX663DRAFT_493513 [Cokeromyces recurvatus]KAI7908246.1 hypothetical protein BX663DRAFT_493513 [Cokeromyces recurvatus]